MGLDSKQNMRVDRGDDTTYRLFFFQLSKNPEPTKVRTSAQKSAPESFFLIVYARNVTVLPQFYTPRDVCVTQVVLDITFRTSRENARRDETLEVAP
mmetsp:Transcript_41195/g.48100  ORF Transcript_41195/g.48100 Transcript_41195/m.48100 type:complete len:97 (+) Transcript_41195:318-608(+)